MPKRVGRLYFTVISNKHFSLLRTTIIEPGPVSTQFAANAKERREEVDLSTIDDKTQALMKETLMAYYQAIINIFQKPSELAELVKKVLLLKNPHFRYQPHPTYRQKEMTTKLKDMNGDGIMELFSNKFAPH